MGRKKLNLSGVESLRGQSKRSNLSGIWSESIYPFELIHCFVFLTKRRILAGTWQTLDLTQRLNLTNLSLSGLDCNEVDFFFLI